MGLLGAVYGVVVVLGLVGFWDGLECGKVVVVDVMDDVEGVVLMGVAEYKVYKLELEAMRKPCKSKR